MRSENQKNADQSISLPLRHGAEEFPTITKMVSSEDRRRQEILSVKIDTFTFPEVIDKARKFLSQDRLHVIATVNPEFVMTAQTDNEFRHILNQSDLNVVDGIGIQKALRLLHGRKCERITGVDLTWALADLSDQQGYSIFFLGSAPGVSDKAAIKLKEKYPALRIAGCYSGSPEEDGIVDRINKTNPDVLLVAFGAPRQEKFIHQNRSRLAAKIAVGVGGTFDYIAEMVPRAPIWMRQIGFEWLYRLFKQPKRFQRIITATIRFPFALLLDQLRNGILYQKIPSRHSVKKID